MDFTILGAGALGSILAAHLSRAGHDVSLVARGQRARLLAEHGVVIRGVSEFRQHVRIVEEPSELTTTGTLILTVKAYDVEAALAAFKHLEVDVALGVQNGVLKDQQIADVFGAEGTLGAIADFSGEVLPAGSVHFTRNEGFYIGELPCGNSERVELLVRALNDAEIVSIASDDILSLEWSKLAGWLGLTAVSVLSRLHTHQVLQSPELAGLQVAIVREAGQVASRLGVTLQDIGVLSAGSISRLDEQAAVASIRGEGEAMQARGLVTHKMSALQDVERGRRLEVEETLGYVLRKGAEFGLEMPALETCYRLLAGIDRHRRSG
jgi:2-dehydropantoate 2-reductase